MAIKLKNRCLDVQHTEIQKPSKKLATFTSGRKHADYYPSDEKYFLTDLVHVCTNHTDSELDSAEPAAEIQLSDLFTLPQLQ